MAVHLVGVNHKTAAVELRELVAVTENQLPAALAQAGRQLRAAPVILSTCNRTELVSCRDDGRRLLDWLAKFSAVDAEKLQGHFYTFEGDEAVAHLVEVASGMDSMIFGETQVFGQLKRAVAAADEFLDAESRHLFDTVFRLAKSLRSNLALDAGASSPAEAVRRLARRMFEDLTQLQIVLVGAGEIIASVAEHFAAHDMRRIKILNRSLARASELAKRVDAEVAELDALAATLAAADVVVSCTDAQQPLIKRSMMEGALMQRHHRPLLMMDLAVPRDIEAGCGDFDDIYLYDIDDIESLVQESDRRRRQTLERGRELIDAGVVEYHRDTGARACARLIQEFRRRNEALRDDELEAALRRLDNGEEPRQLLEELARALTQKLMHAPSAGLRELGADGDARDIAAALKLLDLDDDAKDEP